MKKSLILISLLFCFFITSVAMAQSPVRVKCEQFTINVPSENTRCYKISENIPVSEGAEPYELATAQIASLGIVYSDYESVSSEIAPAVIFYQIEDIEKTSFDLLDLSMDLNDILNNIGSEYADFTTLVSGLPFLPYQASERKVNALPEHLVFNNGSGIRVVTTFQDTVITSSGMSNLYYTFQGLSSDGRYYISAVFPLRSSEIDNRQVSEINWNGLTPDSFIPSLDQLDYFIQSIVIE